MEQENSPARPVVPDTTGAAPATPQAKPRHNGWSPRKMTAFLEALTETGSVTDAAKAVGMSRQSAHRLRAMLIGQPFDIAWEAALEIGLQQVAHAALDRALNGTVVPVFYKGEQVGERRVFNERATLNLMLMADRIGRNPIGRDFASRNWLGLLKRIEHGPIVWTNDEAAGSDPRHPAHNEDADYENAEAESDDEALEAFEPEDAQTRAYRIQEEADLFAEEQSHYSVPFDMPQKRSRPRT
jgi:hypothetical protein